VVAVGEHPELGQAEVPQRGALGRDDSRHDVEETDDVGEEGQQHRVHHETGRADDPEPCEPQAGEQRQVAHPFPDGRLAPAGVPFAEGEGNLPGAEIGIADQQVQQDLESARPQRLRVDRVTAHEEEPAHRIAHAAKAVGEEHPCDRGRRARRHRSAPAKTRAVTAGAVAAGHHQILLVRLGLLEELRH
jgi:hypothetical protein